MTNQGEMSTGSASSPMMDGMRESTSRVAGQATEVAQQVQDDPTPRGLMGAVEDLPATVYLWATLGSIGVSLLLRLAGKREFANFVGLWPPTIVALALMNKQLRPSREM